LTGWIELCRPHLLPRRVLGRAASRCRRDDGITAAIAANEASGSAGQWSVPFQVLPLRVTSISPVRHCLRQAFRSAVEAHHAQDDAASRKGNSRYRGRSCVRLRPHWLHVSQVNRRSEYHDTEASDLHSDFDRTLSSRTCRPQIRCSRSHPQTHPGSEDDLKSLSRGIGADLIGVSTSPSIDSCPTAFRRRHAPPHGCVICGKNVSCRTVNYWVRLPCGLRHAIPLQNDLKGKHTRHSFGALAQVVRMAGPLPGRAIGSARQVGG